MKCKNCGYPLMKLQGNYFHDKAGDFDIFSNDCTNPEPENKHEVKQNGTKQ